MGGLVLAMTLVATFTSASSFIGGPGVAYEKGLVWVYLSMIQVPTAFIILGILGKKFALISRKTGAVTVTDYLRARYKSKAVVWISSICLVLFFVAQMMSQFIGGAVLFQSITGLPYIYGLVLFGAVVIIYTTIGGFKAVTTTDTIQGIIMVIGGFIILATIVTTAGGFDSLIGKLNVANPDWADITSGGSTAKAYVMSFWVLVGVGVLGLPQTAVRGMGFKDTKALHNAIIYRTIVVGFLMLVMHISGVFAPAVLDSGEFETTDYVVPALVLKYMNPVVAGLFIAAPLAAVMSTVSSLLILASAAIVKDLYMNYIAKPEAKKRTEVQRQNQMDVHRNYLPDRCHRVHLYRLSAGSDRVDQSLRHGRAGMCLLLPDSLRPVLEESQRNGVHLIGGLRRRSLYPDEYVWSIHFRHIAHRAVHHHFCGGLCHRRFHRQTGRSKDTGSVLCRIDKTCGIPIQRLI